MQRRQARALLGTLWIIDGLLQAQPEMFSRAWPLGQLAKSAMGEPAWVNHSIFAVLGWFAPSWPWWNLAAVALQLGIGTGLLLGRAVKPALAVSFAWLGLIWWMGEGFGTLPSGFALMLGGAPGPALLYAAIGALAWPSGQQLHCKRPQRHQRAILARLAVAPGACTKWLPGSKRAHHSWRDGSWSYTEPEYPISTRACTGVWLSFWLGTTAAQAFSPYSSRVLLRSNLKESEIGQPGYLVAAARWMYTLSASHGSQLIWVMAVLQVSIGLAALNRSHRRIWLSVAIALSVFYWVVGQDLGGVLAGGATDPGLGPLVVLLAAVMWKEPAQVAPSHYHGLFNWQRQARVPAKCS